MMVKTLIVIGNLSGGLPKKRACSGSVQGSLFWARLLDNKKEK
jgi:hypothetical protein